MNERKRTMQKIFTKLTSKYQYEHQNKDIASSKYLRASVFIYNRLVKTMV